MDSEVVITTSDNRSLQFLLDCGRIAYLRIEQTVATLDDEIAKLTGELTAA